MTEYIYKGFQIHYIMKHLKKQNDSYRATGSVFCYINGNGPALTQKFQTEGSSKDYVENEIKKIINNYIDFEWDQFVEAKANTRHF